MTLELVQRPTLPRHRRWVRARYVGPVRALRGVMGVTQHADGDYWTFMWMNGDDAGATLRERRVFRTEVELV